MVAHVVTIGDVNEQSSPRFQNAKNLSEDAQVILHGFKITKTIAQKHDHIKGVGRVAEIAGISFLKSCAQPFFLSRRFGSRDKVMRTIQPFRFVSSTR